jgi:hypothetical protein
VIATVVDEVCGRTTPAQVWQTSPRSKSASSREHKEMPDVVYQSLQTALLARHTDGADAKWADASVMAKRDELRRTVGELKHQVLRMESQIAAANATCATGPEDLASVQAELEAVRSATVVQRRNSIILLQCSDELAVHTANQERHLAKINAKTGSLRLEVGDLTRATTRMAARCSLDTELAAAKECVFTDRIAVLDLQLKAAHATVDRAKLVHDALSKQRTARELEMHAARNCPSAIIDLRSKVATLQGQYAEARAAADTTDKRLATAAHNATSATAAEEQKAIVLAQVTALKAEVQTVERFRNARRSLANRKIAEVQALEAQITKMDATASARDAVYDAMVLHGEHLDTERGTPGLRRSNSLSRLPLLATSSPTKGRTTTTRKGRRFVRSPSLPVMQKTR